MHGSAPSARCQRRLQRCTYTSNSYAKSYSKPARDGAARCQRLQARQCGFALVFLKSTTQAHPCLHAAQRSIDHCCAVLRSCIAMARTKPNSPKTGMMDPSVSTYAVDGDKGLRQGPETSTTRGQKHRSTLSAKHVVFSSRYCRW